MRDYVDECLRAEQYRLDEAEYRTPICDRCKCHMTGVEYLYEIDGDLICDDCIMDYLKQYRHRVEDFMEGR